MDTEVKDRSEDRAAFVRLANKRVTKALKYIHLIGNLSNTSNYYYQEQDIIKIFHTLQYEIEDCKKRFEAKKKVKPTFSLEDC